MLTTLMSPCVSLKWRQPTNCWSFSPLLPYEEPILPSPELLPISEATWSILHDSWSATRIALDQLSGSCSADCHRRARHHGCAVIEDGASGNEHDLRATATEDPTLAEACLLAAAIHLRVTNIQNRIRYKDLINEEDAEALHKCLSSRMKLSWIELREVAPFLYIWM